MTTIKIFKTLEDFQEIEADENGTIRWRGSKKPYNPTYVKSSNKYKIIYSNPGEKKKIILCHKFIAMLFVPNPNSYKYVRALDGDYTNLKASNLGWFKTAK